MGKGVHDTVRFFKERYGEKDLTVIAIGPGGENLVRFACWVNEHDCASGRGGTGCVGGSKLLKAIVVKAPRRIPKAADTAAWKAAHKRALATIMEATEKGYTNGAGGLQWGDIYAMVDMVRKIAFREGIGAVLADGAEPTAPAR